jgi:D-alanyl-D-alanine carboxypeptidase
MNQAEKYLNELIDHNKTPCVSYHIFNRSNTIYEFTGGFSDVGKKIKLNGETTFNLFSITKTFTALAILQLCEQGKLEIDEPAKKYLPDFPYSSAINIQLLLTHSAGIPNPIPLNWIHLASEHSSFDRNQFFKAIFLKNYKIKSAPNEKYAYSNLGYFLLGRIIENVTGLNYEQYIISNVIKKLNLSPSDLGFTIHDTAKHSKGYIREMSFSNLLLGIFIDKSKYMTKAVGKWKPFNFYYVNGPSYGGLIGTSKALVKYIQELLCDNSSLITNNYKKFLFTENTTSNNRATGMCMSWFCGKLNEHQYFCHAGGGGGYYCEIRIYNNLGIGSVIVFNRTGMKDERVLNAIDSHFIMDRS